MLQEDSNGETFEIINKNIEYPTSTVDKTESLSSISSSTSLLPSPGVSLSSVPSASGNLLSNVAPPSALPNFLPTAPTPVTTAIPPSLLPPSRSHISQNPIVSSQPVTDPYYPTQFSAAIPPSKGVQLGSTNPPLALNEESGGLIGWMRGAVSSGGLLSKVATKAKNSVDSMIITLDPQMREYIYSGGDLDILVASQQEVKVSAIQEGFQIIFGKATVKGIAVQPTGFAAQPVGFDAGVKSAEERIQEVFKNPNVQPHPVVAIENFLVEIGEDKWYDVGVLIINDPARQLSLQTFTQMTPVPSSVVALAQEDTPSEYLYKSTGYAVTIGSLMGKNLGVSHSEWHHALTGVSRREIILLAAKSLASLYKSSIVEH